VTAHDLDAGDLQGLTPEEFEKLTFLLARGEDNGVVIVRNKDRGLDARLPDPLGRLTIRGWQAKRFSTGAVQWAQCEESLKTALAFWRPLRITFVFAHDLSAAEQKIFETRLVKSFPIVRLDFWSAEEVLRRLRETDEGQRAVAWLFGRQGTLEELLASMVGKEPVVGAGQIAERQAALNEQFDSDPHLYYTTVIRSEGAPETPPAPNSVASVVLSIEGQEVRFDLSERYHGALQDLGGGPILVTRDDAAGQRAGEALSAAVSEVERVAIDDGLGVFWPSIPVGLRGLLPEQPLWGAVELSAEGEDEVSSDAVLPMLVRVADESIGVGLTAAPEAERGFDATLIGATGGLEISLSLRFSDQKIEAMNARWRHTLGGGTAIEQLLSARLILAALQGSEIVFEIPSLEGPPGLATAVMDDHDLSADEIEQLSIRCTFLEYTCEVQGWLGVPLFPPVRLQPDDATELERALAVIRQPSRTGTWTALEIVDGDEDADVPAKVDAAILQPLYVRLFGQEHYLGMDLVQVHGAKIERSPEGTRLLPNDSEVLSALLHHPGDVPEEAASSKVGPRRGRVLIRPARAGPKEENDI